MGNEGKFQMVEVAKLFESKTNPRQSKDAGKMKELEDSIREKGVLQPIVVRMVKEGYEIVCGARRFVASKNVGLSTVPAVIRVLDDKAVLEIQLIENAQRADVHPLEEAEGYERLMKQYKYTAEEIAAKVAKSKGYVYQRMALCSLVPECRKMFYDGKLTPSTALLIARMPQDLQKKAAKDITDGYNGIMSLQEARRHIERSYMLELKDAPWVKNEACVVAGKVACVNCPKRTGNQELLFADLKSGDQCTDPACFAEKKSAWGQRQLESAKKTGLKIVPTKEAFPPNCYSDSVCGGYVDIQDTCYESEASKKYVDLMKRAKDMKPSVTVDKRGNVIQIVKKADAIKAFKEAGIKMETEGSSRSPEDMSKAKKENRVREAKRGFWISKVATTEDQRSMNVVMLHMLFNDLGWNPSEEIAGRERGIERLYMRGNDDVLMLIKKAVQKKADVLCDDELEFLAGRLGFDASRDYVITKEYLNAMTKDDLAKLAKEIGIDHKSEVMGEEKKSGLVAAILKNAPNGKVPAEFGKPKAKAKK
jgi:ParB/RepB/Spo0J family partition protein